MARTKGAKDKGPRKKSLSMTPNAIRKRAKLAEAQTTTAPEGVGRSRAGTDAGPPARTMPAQTTDEFNAAIDAALHEKANPSTASAAANRPVGETDRVGEPAKAPAGAVAEEVLLTRQAWEGVCRVPFRTLALLLQMAGVIDQAGQTAIGNLAKKRAPDLARPSYVIFEHYAREYARMNPDDPISLAIVATGLVAADIAEELGEIIMVDRAVRRSQPQPKTEQAAPAMAATV